MLRAMLRLIACLVLFAALAAPTHAQEARSKTPQISARELAMRFATGRYVAPVRCTREDGSLVELQEAVTVRADPRSVGTTTGKYALRATFFGIDVSGVKHCHNLMTMRLSDRRGILHLSFRGQARKDLGLSYFRMELRDGQIEYHVQEGRLHTREIGSEAEPAVMEFDDDAEFIIRELTPNSDPARMLERFAARVGIRGALRPFEFEVASEQGSFKLWVLKDTSANSRGHRSGGSRR
jgi:hypothetical protein